MAGSLALPLLTPTLAFPVMPKISLSVRREELPPRYLSSSFQAATAAERKRTGAEEMGAELEKNKILPEMVTRCHNQGREMRYRED